MNDRTVVDSVCSPMDPDALFDAKWLKEAQDRLAAYRSGDLVAVDAEQVFHELGKRV